MEDGRQKRGRSVEKEVRYEDDSPPGLPLASLGSPGLPWAPPGLAWAPLASLGPSGPLGTPRPPWAPPGPMGPRGRAGAKEKIDFFDFFIFEIWGVETRFLSTADNIEMPEDLLEKLFFGTLFIICFSSKNHLKII